MAKPILSQERLHEVLDYEPQTGTFTWRAKRGRCAKGSVAGRPTWNGYTRIDVDLRTYYAHRLAWFYAHGVWPADDIDHIDRDKTNNCLDNLRLATRSENQQNHTAALSNSQSGLRGVKLHRKNMKWQAKIKVHAVVHSLGYFESKEEAHAAYLEEKKRLHPFYVHS